MEIELDYFPRPWFRAFHDRAERFACLVCHRGAGKTVASVHELQRGAVTCNLVRPRFAYIAPFLKQAKSVAWGYLSEAMSPLREIGASLNESELRADYPNGGQVRLFGADNPDALRGMHYDGVVLDEFADMDPETWTKIIFPALIQRNGWVVFIGTPKGHNEFYKVWNRSKIEPGWFSLMLKASDTGLLSAEDLEIARLNQGEDEFQQEFECSFETAIHGAFYAEELRRAETDKRISRIPIERAIKVHTSWDLGYTDSTAIWFIQCVGKERRLVDYYESSGVGLDHYAKVLKEKGYVYGEHYFPHDIGVHELATGHSRVDTLRGLGIEPRYDPEPGNVLDGINATRRLLDSCWIDSERCARGLDALKQYRREWDERLKDWKQRPLHDWSSHGADALRTFATQMPSIEGFGRSINYPNQGYA